MDYNQNSYVWAGNAFTVQAYNALEAVNSLTVERIDEVFVISPSNINVPANLKHF
jgi:hypothetical protein